MVRGYLGEKMKTHAALVLNCAVWFVAGLLACALFRFDPKWSPTLTLEVRHFQIRKDVP